MEFKAHFFDGKTSNTHWVNVQARSNWASVELPGGQVLKLDIAKAQINHNGPDKYMLELAEGALLVCLKKDLEKAFPNHVKRSVGSQIRDQRVLVFALAAIALVLLSFLVFVSWNLDSFNGFIVDQISDEVEQEIGDAAYDQYMIGEEIDPGLTSHVDWFASEIGLPSELEVTVIERTDFNAVSFPGNRIVIHKAALESIETMPELAALLGHEYGHILHKHGLKAMVNNLATSAAVQLIFGSAEVGGLLSNGIGELANLSYSRDLEREADEYSLLVLSRNNLDLMGAIQLMELLGEDSEDLEFLSTHPVSSNRIQFLEGKIEGWKKAPGDFNIGAEKAFKEIQEMLDKANQQITIPLDSIPKQSW